VLNLVDVLFIANKSPAYRIGFFNGLAKKLNIKFVFTHEDKEITGLKADYIFSKGLGYKKYLVHPDLRKIITKEKPKKVVFLPPDPLHLLDNLYLYNYVRRKKIPYYIWTETWKYGSTPLKNKVNEFFLKKVYSGAEKIFVSGKKSFTYMQSFVNKTKIKIIGDVSQIDITTKELSKNSHDFIKKYDLKNKKIILYVGRLIKRKGIEYLISAFSKIKDKSVVLVIIGGGDFYNLGEPTIRKTLTSLVSKFDLSERIIFTGHLPSKQVATMYFLSDVLVVPSITDKIGEPWGLIVNEAMQFGLPVIATDAVGSALDLIKNGKNGFIVQEKNDIAIKIAVEKIIYDKKLKTSMKKYNLDYIKNRYNYDFMINNFVSGLK